MSRASYIQKVKTIMNNSQITDKINSIGEKSFSKLKELSIPLYPRYYHDTFMDTLSNEEDPSLIDLTNKHPYLFTLEHEDMQRELSLELAKTSLQEFEQSNQNLKNISDANVVDISTIKQEYERIHAKEVLDVLDIFQSKILNELKKADETISKLKLEIERLERESHIDPLTKAYNRRVLVKDLEELLLSCEKSNLFLVIFDADDFKVINDSYGHIAGDKTLIYLSKLLQSSLQKHTKIYRYGGEEFIILLQDVTLENVQNITSKILQEVDQSKLLYKGFNIHLTLSAGIAHCNNGETIEDILDKADKALYDAKRDGKNCFKVSTK